MTRAVGPVAAMMLAVSSCMPGGPDLSTRLRSDDMSYRIYADPTPPRAREDTKYRVVVRDTKTGQPIENGEGRIFATSRDNINTWDPLLPGPELGTYYGKLSFITAGEWAIAVEFRRDSTQRLQRVDWMQEVFPARGEKD